MDTVVEMKDIATSEGKWDNQTLNLHTANEQRKKAEHLRTTRTSNNGKNQTSHQSLNGQKRATDQSLMLQPLHFCGKPNMTFLSANGKTQNPPRYLPVWRRRIRELHDYVAWVCQVQPSQLHYLGPTRIPVTRQQVRDCARKFSFARTHYIHDLPIWVQGIVLSSQGSKAKWSICQVQQ